MVPTTTPRGSTHSGCGPLPGGGPARGIGAQLRPSDEVQAWPLLLTARNIDPLEPITPSGLVIPAGSPSLAVGAAPSGLNVVSVIQVLPPSIELSRLGPPPGTMRSEVHMSIPSRPNSICVP